VRACIYVTKPVSVESVRSDSDIDAKKTNNFKKSKGCHIKFLKKGRKGETKPNKNTENETKMKMKASQPDRQTDSNKYPP